MRRVVNNFSMDYEDHGKGIPLVFVHGFPLSRRMWQPQLSGLSDIARIITMDLRGHGDSEAKPGPYSMELMADDLISLLDVLNINERVILCGLSMGGYVVFSSFRKYRERIAGLILTSTRAGADSQEGKLQRDQTVSKVESDGKEPVIEGMLPKLMAPATYEQKPDLVNMVRDIMLSISTEGMVGDLIAMRDREDSVPLLNAIDIPTLIIHGTEDQIIPVTEAEKMEAGIPNSRLRVLPSAGHLPNLEQPVLYNQEVSRFLINF